MTRLAATQLRDELTDTINRVAYGGERIVLERHGKGLAALISLDDLRLLQQLEDKEDIEAARLALAEAKEKGTRSLAEVKAELGL
jgi:prevent-host-death family protein